MMVFWCLAITFLMFAYFLPAARRFKQRYDFAKTLSGPSMLEVIGATRKNRLLEFMLECRQKYGSVFRIWVGPDLTVFFTDPEDVRTILQSNDLIDKSDKYSYFEVWLGKGLLTNGGNDWHTKRKLLTPVFHYQILSKFKEPIEVCCNILIDRLTEVADGREVNIYDYMTLFALDVICETAMGIHLNAQLNEESDFVRSTYQACHLIHKQVFSIWKRIPWLYTLSSEKRQRDEALQVLHKETKRVIQMRRSQLDSEHKLGDMSGHEAKQRRPFLDSLLMTQRETGMLTDANIQEEVDTFMFAGHDTTSSALSFGIYLLAQHPDVQQKLFEEINLSESSDSAMSWPYMEAVIKEINRLYPSVPSFSRQSNEPFKVGKHLVPAGVSIGLGAYVVHREPAHFPDPELFRPERFIDSDQPIHPFALIAFSAGPRNCIGQKFALLELKISFAKLLRAFVFTALPDFHVKLVNNVALKSSNGVKVRIHKRQK